MKRKILKLTQIIIVSLISYYIIFLSSFLTISSYKSVLPYYSSLLGLKILSFIFIVSVYLILLGVSNSNWISTSILLFLSFAIAFINRIKLVYRNEPFLPSDLSMVNSLPQLIRMVTILQVFLIISAIFIISFLSFSIFKKRNKFFSRGKITRIITIVISLIISVGFLSINKANSIPHKISMKLNNNPFYWDAEWGVKRNGPLLNFANYLYVSIMDKPDGYSEKKMNEIYYKYKNRAKVENKNRNLSSKTDVVMILSESFSDPTRIKEIQFNQDPISFTRNLMENNPSGWMLSNGYGGGTANMEFQALTSMSFGNFSMSVTNLPMQVTPVMKSPFTINNMFNQSIAVHPYSEKVYNRKNMLNTFGFSKFYSEDGSNVFPYDTKLQNNQYVADSAVYKFVLEQIKANKSGTFYHVITMQNHMPFSDNEYPDNNFKVKGKISNREKKQIESYAKGINFTDQANKSFLNELKKLKKNVVVIFYGDHLPGIYNHVDFKKNGILMHQTPYFIWSNHLELKKDTAPQLIGPYSFGNIAFDAANFKVSPYYALLNDVTKQLPIITSNMESDDSLNLERSNIQMVSRESNNFINERDLSKEQIEILHDYQLVQYDLSAGKHYLSPKFTNN